MRRITALESRELKKHIQKAVFPKMVGGMLLCVILVFLNIGILCAWVFPLSKNYDYLRGRINQVIISNIQYPEYYSEYQFSDLITISNARNNRINVNAYMLKPDSDDSLFDIDSSLSKDEIAISEKVAKKLGVVVGSQVYLELSIYEQPKEYTVVSIIPYCWNYYNVFDNSDFSVVHLGYNETLIRNTSIKNIYYLNGNEYRDYSDKNYSYTNHYDVEAEIKSMQSRICLLLGVCVVVSTIVSVIFLLYFSKRIKNEVTKYYHNGFSVDYVKKVHVIDYVLLYCIPVILFGCCITVISLAVHFISLWLLSIALIDIIAAVTMLLRETKAYGKID